MADETWPGAPVTFEEPPETIEWPGQPVNLDSPRIAQAAELDDPDVAAGLYNLTHNEVGSQGPEAQQAFIETVFNRAHARGMTIAQTINDRKYYPEQSFRTPGADAYKEDRVNSYKSILNQVVDGSNISGNATGNASGKVGFAGGPETFKAGGERFGIEGPDLSKVPTGKKVALETYTPEEIIPVRTLETRRATAVHPEDEQWPGQKIEAPQVAAAEDEIQFKQPETVQAPQGSALVEGVSRSFKKLGDSLLPLAVGDLTPLWNMIVPNADDFKAIGALVKPETYKKNVEIGSPEYYEQVTDNAIPLAGVAVGAGLKGRAGNPAGPEFQAGIDSAMKARTQSPTSEAGLPYTFPRVRKAGAALPPEDFIDVPFVRVETGTIGDRVSQFMTPTEGTRPAGGMLLHPGEEVPAPLAGYPLIPHADGSHTIVDPSQLEGAQEADMPPIMDPYEAFMDEIETPTPEDLKLPTMSASEFDNYLADIQRQEELSIAKEESGFGGESTPVSTAVMDMGGLLSKSGAKARKIYEGNAAIWDDAPKLSTPKHNKIYNPNGELPDIAANALFDAGLIPEPTHTAMYDALKSESQTAAGGLVGAPKPIQGFTSNLPSIAEVQHDFESLGLTDQERLVVQGKHYVVANPATGEIRELFPSRGQAMDYLRTSANPGEAIVKRQPGKPDQLVAKLPDDVASTREHEIVKAQKATGKRKLSGKDWDQYLGTTPELFAPAEIPFNLQGEAPAEVGALTAEGAARRGAEAKYAEAKAQTEIFSQKGEPLTAAEQKTYDTLSKLSDKGNHLSKSGRAKLERLHKKKKASQAGGISLQPLEPAAKAIRESIARSKLKDQLLAKEGAVENFSVIYPRERTNMIRRDFGTPAEALNKSTKAYRDLEALGILTDHGLDKASVRAGRDKVATSKTAAGRALTAKYDYALNNFDRIKNTPNRLRDVLDYQIALEKHNKINLAYRSDYLPHILSEDPKGFFGSFTPTSHGPGGTAKWFTKSRSYPTLADAIHDGEIPKSLNAADLSEVRLRAGQRLILRKAYRELMQKLKAPDGKPVAMDKPTRGYETMKLHGVDVHVHPEVADYVAMLFEPSAIRRSAIGRGALTVAGVQKQFKLALDTFHAARLSAYNFGAGKGRTRFGYKRGLGVLELAPEDYARAIKSGEFNASEVKYARENRPLMMELLAQGANVGQWADNIAGQMRHKVPGTRTVNAWIFDSLGRGALTQGLIENYKRVLSRFPELTRQQAARKAVIEMNENFGNLGRKTLFKHKTFQDAAQMVLLARQWVESQFKSEARAYGQIAAYPVNVVEGLARGQGVKSFGRLGVTAQSRLSLALGLLVAGQILNYALNGKSTFENPEGKKFQVRVPIGDKVYYFDTAQIPFEFSHQILKYMRKGEGVLGTAAHIAENKLSSLARGAKILATGKSYRGGAVTQPGTMENVRQFAAEQAPLPIFSGGLLEPEPRSNWLFRLNRRTDALSLQGAASLGAKLEPEESPRDTIYKLVREKGFEKPGEDHGPGKYSQLKRALDNGDSRAVQEEMSLLMKEAPTRKDKLEMFKNIKETLGIRSLQAIERDPSRGAINPTLFTGRVKEEISFRRQLAPEERTLYNDAQKAHQRSARFFLMLEPQLRRLNL